MAVTVTKTDETASISDPLLPWLRSIRKALDNKSFGILNNVLKDCIRTFKDHAQYKDDPRFLKVWLLYLEDIKDVTAALKEMEENSICSGNSLAYELYASLLEAKEQWQEANMVYQTGILRKAMPLERLKQARALFHKRMAYRVNVCSIQKNDENKPNDLERGFVNPWASSTLKELLQKINPKLKKYDGFYSSNKPYPGKLALTSLSNTSRNKIIEIGGKKYQIKGCAGKGGFAQVYKAYINGNPDDTVALKIQKPPFPWEFYMYRQLDHRISDKQRQSFGFAHKVHLYSDFSILICDYLSHGTLQDVINSYVVIGKSMEEVLCIYYTIEMLYMLETLHDAGIIHGDFKPDNLLVRNSSDNLTEEGFQERSGPWSDQGLCLVDWGRGIDLQLFRDHVKFEGDCRTSGFRCVEMQEKKPWTFQVDTYGLCVIVHMMLHNTYMEITKKQGPDCSYTYLPKAPFKRYWKVELWKNLFTQLLNVNYEHDKTVLQNLRKCFQEYLCSDPQLLKKLRELLAKQRLSLCSA